MSSGLVLLSIVLIAMVGALCTMLYSQQSKLLVQSSFHQEMLVNLESTLQQVTAQQQAANKRIDQLATDVLQREIYQSADDRHQLAIKSAKQGKGLFELMQRHGLSSDEAALIMSLHAPQNSASESLVKNANLSKPNVVNVI